MISSILSRSISGPNIQSQSLQLLPAVFLQWFPFLLVPFGGLPLMLHERRMACTIAALTRVERILQRVEASRSIRSGDIEWIGAESWEGVDWSVISQ